MEEFTYEQIREKALKQGVPDTKQHIGMWATLNNSSFASSTCQF